MFKKEEMSVEKFIEKYSHAISRQIYLNETIGQFIDPESSGCYWYPIKRKDVVDEIEDNIKIMPDDYCCWCSPRWFKKSEVILYFDNKVINDKKKKIEERLLNEVEKEN